MAAGMGVDMEFIDAAEVGRRHPLINTDGLLGAWWDPLDGDIDPAGITFALARKAREAGAEVYRFNPVESITRKANGEFIVHTRRATLAARKWSTLPVTASTRSATCSASRTRSRRWSTCIS